jgi:hypothetical protein
MRGFGTFKTAARFFVLLTKYAMTFIRAALWENESLFRNNDRRFSSDEQRCRG